MADMQRTLDASGRALTAAAGWLARHVREAYRSVDPDVPRHLAQLPLLGTSLFVKRDAPIVAAPTHGRPPVLFVHGLGGNRGAFWPMVAYLRLRGQRGLYSVDLRRHSSLEAMAEAVVAVADEVLRVNDAAQLDIVAHSLGGIIVRLALCEPLLAHRVRTLVTLGTPHAGTYPARYANTPITRALRPDSELMRRLSATALPEGMRVVTLWSRNDLFVLPPESAILAGAEAVDATPFTHYSYLVEPRAWEMVRVALTSSPSAPLHSQPAAAAIRSGR